MINRLQAGKQAHAVFYSRVAEHKAAFKGPAGERILPPCWAARHPAAPAPACPTKDGAAVHWRGGGPDGGKSGGRSNGTSSHSPFHRAEHEPGHMASLSCALAVDDAEQADILQKPRSTRAQQGLSLRKTGLSKQLCLVAPQPNLLRRPGSAHDAVKEPADDQQAGDNADTIAKNINTRHDGHPSP